MTIAELFREIDSCRNFIRRGGVTLSGGEPLLQPEFAAALLRRCRSGGYHTALDTAGSLPLEHSREALDAADLILLDIKALDDALCRQLTGRGNAETLATLDYCEAAGKPVWIRHVLVPGLTMDSGALSALGRFLNPYRCIRRVELLPYHKLGVFKWERLGLTDPLADTPEPSPEEVRHAEASFHSGYRR